MGLTPHEYYCMSPLEFYYAVKGYNRKKEEQWQHTRFIGYYTVSTIPSKKKLPPIQKWFPLPSDKITISDDRIKKMLNLAKNKIKNG